MHTGHRWRRKVLGTQAGHTVESVVVRHAVARALLLGTCLAQLALGTVQRAGAEDTDASGAGTANVLTCEAAGGEATVSSHQTANGRQTVSVECNGGYLDGWDCLHDTEFGTWYCSTEIIIVPDDGAKAPTGGLGLEPPTNGGGTVPPAAGTDNGASLDAQPSAVAPADEPPITRPVDAPLEMIAETSVTVPVENQVPSAAESGTLAAPSEVPVTLIEEPAAAEETVSIEVQP